MVEIEKEIRKDDKVAEKKLDSIAKIEKEIIREEKQVEKFFHKKSNLIMSIIIAVLAIALILVIFLPKGISANSAGEKIVAFASSQGTDAKLVSVSSESGLYKVTLSIDGQELSVYVTKDGKLFTAQMIPLTASTDSSSDSGQTTDISKAVNIPIGNSPVLGNLSATLTIVEFSDFSCPFCGAASGATPSMVEYMQSRDPSWTAPIPGIIKDYVNTGKAKLVYKYAMGHGGAHPATLVGWCLNDQALFWKFHDLAFANQADVEDLAKMKDLAKTLGANMNTLNSCLDSKKYDSKLDEDQALANSIGLGGTPGIYANGIKVANGAETYTKVKAAIEAVLAAQ